MYIVYKHTSPSGKSYIGFTKKALMERWQAHYYNATAPRNKDVRNKFWRAIRRYRTGWIHEPLAECKTAKQAKALEVASIARFDTFRNGYNSTPGADGCVAHTPDARRRIAEGNRGNKNHFGHKHSEQSKRQISESRKGIEPWNKGLKNPQAVTEVTREKLRLSTIEQWRKRKERGYQLGSNI